MRITELIFTSHVHPNIISFLDLTLTGDLENERVVTSLYRKTLAGIARNTDIS